MQGLYFCFVLGRGTYVAVDAVKDIEERRTGDYGTNLCN